MFFEGTNKPSEEVVDRLVEMSKGNPGGATVLSKLFEGVSEEEAVKDIDILDKAGIYGGNLWIGYKDFCKEDINEFRKQLRAGNIIEKQIKESRYFINYE